MHMNVCLDARLRNLSNPMVVMEYEGGRANQTKRYNRLTTIIKNSKFGLKPSIHQPVLRFALDLENLMPNYPN